MLKISLSFLLLSFFVNSYCQSSAELQNIGRFIEEEKISLLNKYIEFTSIPNTLNDAEMLRENANFIVSLMKEKGISNVRLLEGNSKETIPAVYGESLIEGARKTLVFYAHYDGQPVNPEKWADGLSPFKPQLTTLRLDKGGQFIDMDNIPKPYNNEWRLYGRATADDKLGVFAIINAFDAIKKMGLHQKINIKFFFEGEEEKGSTHLNEILENHKSLLSGDLWVIADGPMHPSGRKQISFGVRGDVNMNLTVFGPARPLHSGNYGNWAPNPAQKLVNLLASMKDENGFVTIKGFYDDVIPLSKSEKKALKEIPDASMEMQKELLFAKSELKGKTFLEGITSLPTLNINGIVSANVGKLASNIIPTYASATIDLRLVKGNDVKRQTEKVINHLKQKGFYVVHKEPTEDERLKHPNIIFVSIGSGYNAQRTSMDLPIAKEVINAIRKTTDKDLVLMPSAGGSLPLYLFEKILKTPPISIPIANYDNNQHGENENVNMGFLFEGIKTIASIMLME